MKQRQLGKNGPNISPIGIGAMSFSNFYGKTSEAESHAILDTALDEGVTHIDTADIYGPLVSEQVIGSYLAKQGAQKNDLFSIATKAGIARDADSGRRYFDNSAAYLEARDQPNLKLMAGWFDKAEGGLPQKIEAIFQNLARSARHPRWKGCGFLRTAAELANLPGHPAIKIGARHKAGFERWLASACADHGVAAPEELARQVVLLMDGAFSVMLVHRDPAYVEAAGRAAAALAAASCPSRPV